MEEQSESRVVDLGRTPSVRSWIFWILVVMTVGLILNGAGWIQSKDEDQRLVGIFWAGGAIYMVIWLLFLRPRVLLRIGPEGVEILKTRLAKVREDSFEVPFRIRQDQVAYHFHLKRKSISVAIHLIPEDVREALLPFLEG